MCPYGCNTEEPSGVNHRDTCPLRTGRTPRMGNGPDGKRFPWGRITEVHTIGPYDIVEFIWKEGDRLAGKTHFCVYLDHRDTAMGSPTLEGALACCIAAMAKKEPAAEYILRMLGLPIE